LNDGVVENARSGVGRAVVDCHRNRENADANGGAGRRRLRATDHAAGVESASHRWETEIGNYATTSLNGHCYRKGGRVGHTRAIQHGRDRIDDGYRLAALVMIAAIIHALPRSGDDLRAGAVGHGTDDGDDDAVAGRAGRGSACVGPCWQIEVPG
jgi:hypothetical protein